MADIKSIAEALVEQTAKDVNELATVMKDEYGIEAIASIEVERQRIENAYNTMSPKEYGISLMKKGIGTDKREVFNLTNFWPIGHQQKQRAI